MLLNIHDVVVDMFAYIVVFYYIFLVEVPSSQVGV